VPNEIEIYLYCAIITMDACSRVVIRMCTTYYIIIYTLIHICSLPPFARNTRRDVAKFENIRLKYDLFLLYTLHAVIDVVMEHFRWYHRMLDVYFYYHKTSVIKFYKGTNLLSLQTILNSIIFRYRLQLAVKCRPMKISVWGKYRIKGRERQRGRQTVAEREKT